MKDIFVVIPAYEPDERLIKLCNDLSKSDMKNVIIVNDGSGASYDSIFEKIETEYHYTILKHKVNKGKGRALKTAFRYLLKEEKDIKGCITADSDGQHCIKDIKKCIDAFEKNPDSLILGCRDFSGDGVPDKSKFGNNVTKAIFSLFFNLKISDTQTGLRVMSKSYMRDSLRIHGERFEYETNMLLDNRNKYPIIEVPIETIYDSKDNHSTHFRPIVDSVKIYANMFKVFFMYIVSALTSSVVDVILFALFLYLLKPTFPTNYIIMATILSRTLSSIYNYFVNCKYVFKSNINNKMIAFKYCALIVGQMLVSGLLVTAMVSKITINEVIAKVIVDTLLFFASFFIQKKYIFNSKKNKR